MEKEESEYSVEYIDTSNNFDFKSGQIIWVKNPKISYRSKSMTWVLYHGGTHTQDLTPMIEKNIVQYQTYLFRTNGEFRFGFYEEKRSCKVNGVEVNQNAEGFSVDKFWELVKILPEGHPIKNRGLSGPPGYYLFRQSSMSDYIINNNPILSGEFLDYHEEGYRFLFSYHTDNDIKSFNNLMKPMERNSKISSILK